MACVCHVAILLYFALLSMTEQIKLFCLCFSPHYPHQQEQNGKLSTPGVGPVLTSNMHPNQPVPMRSCLNKGFLSL